MSVTGSPLRESQAAVLQRDFAAKGFAFSAKSASQLSAVAAAASSDLTALLEAGDADTQLATKACGLADPGVRGFLDKAMRGANEHIRKSIGNAESKLKSHMVEGVPQPRERARPSMLALGCCCLILHRAPT